MKFSYSAEVREGIDVIYIGRSFRLFEHFYTRRDKTRKKRLPDLYRHIYLKSGGLLPQFSITIVLRAIDFDDDLWEQAQYLITPYSKKSMKQLINTAEREDSLKKLQEEKVVQRQVAQQNPYQLYIVNTYDDFCENGIANNTPFETGRGRSFFEPTFRSSLFETLCRLRIQISFNDLNLVYEAMPITEALEDIGELCFGRFYPLTIDKLEMSNNNEWQLDNGDPLHVPPNPKKLQQVRGRFTLA